MSGDLNDTPEYILELRREKTTNENKATALEFAIMRLQEDLSKEMHDYARLKGNVQRMRSSAEAVKIELENALHERRILQGKEQALRDTIKLNEICIATLKAERSMVHHSLYTSLSEPYNAGDKIKHTVVNNQTKTTPRTNTSEETRTQRRNTNDFLKLIENRDEWLNTFVPFENKMKIDSANASQQTPPSTAEAEAAFVTNYSEEHTEIEIQNEATGLKVDYTKHENNQSMKNGVEEEEEGLTIANELKMRYVEETSVLNYTHKVSKYGDEVERGIPTSSARVSQLKDEQENITLEFKRVCTKYDEIDEKQNLSTEAIPDSVNNELVNTELVNNGLVDTYMPEKNKNTPEVLRNHTERIKKIESDTRQLESEEGDKLNIKTMVFKSRCEKLGAANQVQDASMFLSSPDDVGHSTSEGRDPKPSIHHELVRTRANLSGGGRIARHTFARWLRTYSHHFAIPSLPMLITWESAHLMLHCDYNMATHTLFGSLICTNRIPNSMFRPFVFNEHTFDFSFDKL